MTRFSRHAVVALMGVCSFAATGCHSPRDQAKRDFQRKVDERIQAEEASLKRYDAAMADYFAGDTEESIAGFREALDRNNRNVPAWNALGVASFHQGDYRTATDAFTRAGRLAPGVYEPHYNRGIVLESTGRYGDAIEAYEQGLRLSPDVIELKENLIRVHRRANVRSERVRELIREALEVEQRPEWRRWLELESIRLTYHLEPASRMRGDESAVEPEPVSATEEAE